MPSTLRWRSNPLSYQGIALPRTTGKENGSAIPHFSLLIETGSDCIA